MKLGPYLIPHLKNNSKWIKDLNVRAKFTRFLGENIEGELHDIAFGNDFLDMTAKAQATKEKVDKLEFIKG